jgi:NADH-quinone oxidoreductase subunit B
LEEVSPIDPIQPADAAPAEATGLLEVVLGHADSLLRWGQANALWPLSFGLKCCAIEGMMATFAARFDLDRFGLIPRPTPRQADLMIVAGTVTVKMAPRIARLWEQMPDPKWCLAMGSCAISGDHYRNVYSVVPGVDHVIPVDVYIPGCPPHPEALIEGILALQRKIREKKA